ncbi:MAG: glycosyltransferase family 9 protein [Gammaproteobacteria bacterium]
MKRQKILVVALGRIGDLVLVTPIFRALKQLDPIPEVHLLAGRNNYRVVQAHPFIDKVHVYSKKPRGTLRLIYTLRTTRFDLWIDPKDHPSRESRLFARIGRYRTAVGFNTPGKPRVFSHSVIPHTEQVGVHMSTRALRALEPLGIYAQDARPLLGVDPQAAQRLCEFLKEHVVSAYCLVNISGAIPDRTWQTEKWIGLINTIAKESNCDFLICCSPRDYVQARQILQSTANTRLYETPSIIEAVAAVARADLVLTVDTSIVHIASAFNKTILSLQPNIYHNYTKYRPLSQHSRCVMAAKEGATVGEIALESALGAYRSLRQELESHGSVKVAGRALRREL